MTSGERKVYSLEAARKANEVGADLVFVEDETLARLLARQPPTGQPDKDLFGLALQPSTRKLLAMQCIQWPDG